MKALEGSFTALATPFKNGSVDEDALRKLVAFQLENGTAGLVPIGTTGEAVTLTGDERGQVVRVVTQAAKGKVPVIAGAGSNSTRETIDNVARVREAGADAALVVTPYYNKPPQAGLLRHFKEIARAHPGFPLVVYNVPSRTGGDLLPETCERLCELPEVVSIKEATGSMPRAIDIFERCGERLTLLSGDDFTVLPFIACGGKGVISVSSNVAPRMMSDLVKHALAGDIRSAADLQIKLNTLHRLLFVEPSPIPVKWALYLMGRFGPEVRLPLVQMGAQNASLLEAELRRLGLLS